MIAMSTDPNIAGACGPVYLHNHIRDAAIGGRVNVAGRGNRVLYCVPLFPVLR